MDFAWCRLSCSDKPHVVCGMAWYSSLGLLAGRPCKASRQARPLPVHGDVNLQPGPHSQCIALCVASSSWRAAGQNKEAVLNLAPSSSAVGAQAHAEPYIAHGQVLPKAIVIGDEGVDEESCCLLLNLSESHSRAFADSCLQLVHSAGWDLHCPRAHIQKGGVRGQGSPNNVCVEIRLLLGSLPCSCVSLLH